jgi:hypothetical protein
MGKFFDEPSERPSNIRGASGVEEMDGTEMPCWFMLRRNC